MKRRRSRRPRQDNLFSSDTSHPEAGRPAASEDAGEGIPERGSEAADSRIERAREVALRLLSRRMRTGREIEEKLSSRGHDRGTVSAVIERLKSVGLIDDAEYAAAFLRTSLKLRPRSYRTLRAELIKKGISPEIANGAIRESSRLVPEIEIARRLLAQASRRYGKLPEQERKRKLFSFLGRRGFSFGTISEFLGQGGENP